MTGVTGWRNPTTGAAWLPPSDRDVILVGPVLGQKVGPLDQLSVLQLWYTGLSVKEIAAITGRSDQAARLRVRRPDPRLAPDIQMRHTAQTQQVMRRWHHNKITLAELITELAENDTGGDEPASAPDTTTRMCIRKQSALACAHSLFHSRTPKELHTRMAQKTLIELVDDLDGTKADETVHIALDGISYEIDLSEDNATRLRAALAEFVAAGRRTGGRQRKRQAAASREENQQIREWGLQNEWDLGARGRLPNALRAAFREAQLQEQKKKR